MAAILLEKVGKELEERPELRIDIHLEHLLYILGRVLQERLTGSREQQKIWTHINICVVKANFCSLPWHYTRIVEEHGDATNSVPEKASRCEKSDERQTNRK